MTSIPVIIKCIIGINFCCLINVTVYSISVNVEAYYGPSVLHSLSKTNFSPHYDCNLFPIPCMLWKISLPKSAGCNAGQQFPVLSITPSSFF
jgi:hypothetical protein